MIEPADIRQLARAAQALAADGVQGQDGASVCEVVLAVRQLREAADHIEVHGLGELDETAYTDHHDGMTTAGWFAHQTSMDPSVGRAQVKVARILRHDLPATDQAWLDGTITREHVRVLVDAANPRIRDQIGQVEVDLIDLADGRVFRTWRECVGGLVARFDEDGPDPTDPANTKASWSRSGAFALLRAQFAGADAEVLEQIIDAKIDELFRRQSRDREQSTDIPVLTRAQLRGHAIAELLLDGHVATASDRTLRNGISLVLRPADDDPSGWPSITNVSWSLTNPAGQHLVLEHFATLLCDCSVHPLLVDADGNPLKLGTDVRFATDKQRRAAVVRDGGLCVFAGCDRRATHFHHVIRYEDGGPTDIDNIAGLCPSHHGVTHRRGWAMHATTDSWFWWVTPSGHTFWSQRHGKQRAGPAPPAHIATAAA